MTLNEFLTKAGQLLGLAEKNLTAEQQLGASQTEVSNLKAQLSQKDTEIASAQASVKVKDGEIVDLKNQLAAKDAELKAKDAELNVAKQELKAAQEQLANPSQQIKAAAAREAQKITAAQGQPPIASQPASPVGGDKKTELTGRDRMIASMRVEGLSANRT